MGRRKVINCGKGDSITVKVDTVIKRTFAALDYSERLAIHAEARESIAKSLERRGLLAKMETGQNGENKVYFSVDLKQ